MKHVFGKSRTLYHTFHMCHISV